MTVTVETSESDDRIAMVAIDNPPVNALDEATRDGLLSAFASLSEGRRGTHVVLLRGAGGRFCAGGDISEMSCLGDGAADRALYESFSAVYTAVRTCPLPVIALIENYAMGGGFELALQADLRYAGPKARLAASAVNLGLAESAHTLSTLIGPSHAAELLLTGRTIDGTYAARVGILSRCVPTEKLEDYVTTTATHIASRPLASVRATKQILLAGTRPPAHATQLAHDRWLALRSSHDHHEALTAFLDHRAPHFEER